MKLRKKLLFAGLATVAVTTFGFSSGEKLFEINKNLDIFATLYKEVNNYYVDEITATELMTEGINAMLANLDPYTNYIPEDKIEDYRTMTTGQYGGVGASVGTRDNKIVILMPFEGFAVDKAGLIIGDEILKIDDTEVTGKNTSDISKMLKGQAGTQVNLLIKRYGESEPRLVKLTRERIQIKNVTYQGMVNDEVGIIRLTDFTRDANKEVKDALNSLKEKGAKSVILDLRGNPGGLLNEAVDIANIFVPKGSEIVSTKGKVKEWNKTYRALDQALEEKMPLVVLTSRSSASAAEIVAGVIQDYDRGILIGENTYGKGLVQATRPLSYNSKLKITVAKYYTPSGRCIQAIDYSNRNEDGSVGKIPDSLRVAFKTTNGRVVYDGGGIKPDIEVEREKLSPISAALYSKNILFDYATQFRAKHPSIDHATKFNLSDAQYEDFVKWAQTKEFEYSSKAEKMLTDLEKTIEEEKMNDEVRKDIENLKKKIGRSKADDLMAFKDEIKELLEAEIASRYYLERGIIETSFDDDPDIKEALNVLKDKQRFEKILAGNK